MGITTATEAEHYDQAKAARVSMHWTGVDLSLTAGRVSPLCDSTS